MDPNAAPITQVVPAGNLLFLSGQMALDATGKISEPDIDGQTRITLSKIDALLDGHQASLANVVNCTVWLTDCSDFPAFNAAYREAFPISPPARATIVSELMIPGAKVEIAVVAYKP